MGEYSTLYINGFEVDSWKNSIGYSYILFSENDFIETLVVSDEDEEDNEPHPIYQYAGLSHKIENKVAKSYFYSFAKQKSNFLCNLVNRIVEVFSRNCKRRKGWIYAIIAANGTM